MTGLYGWIAVPLVLLLLMLLRVGAVVEFSGAGLEVRLRIGPLRIPVFPVKRPDKNKAKPTPERKKKEPGIAGSKGGRLDLLLEGLPLVLDTVKKLQRKLRVDVLRIELTVSAPDPGDTAMQYGQANALLASLWEPITGAFHVKDGSAHVGIDFNAGASSVYLLASLSLRFGQVIALAAVFGGKALGIMIHSRRNQKHQLTKRKAVKNGTQPSHH